MRTTIDLPPYTHQRIKEIAATNGLSLSAQLGELVTSSLQRDYPQHTLTIDPLTGLPLLPASTPFTAQDVTDFLAEND